ncbi:MAG: TetR/AcrR family transcriptional regulator [Clostridium sp.]|uniref:Fatty acid metabolism regulator protein n=1 Tax=Clostridium paraputrificum TaxID=29363 RepID=A0A6N3FVV9_9CLOT|nr:TetR/AcrR family transcriptional regulator [Clostridium sp.]MBS5926888.1 TetR/AcrR family transcriptional regulator [Clostridium sp.]MBS5986407.1 TetR/AcrR family transcriptional regulator [Clostridium sp.]
MTRDKSVSSKVGEKKRKKEIELFSAAYELFTTKGTQNTAIDDIVKRAGVAKGTFYLYFKDKYDIINRLILQKSSQVIKEAVEKTEEQKLEKFEDRTLFFIDYVINYFKENKLMLKLINKNFSWGLFRRALRNPEQYKEMEGIVEIFIGNLVEKNMNLDEAELTLFMIFELVGSVCYSSIILEEPTTIDEIKPILFKKVLAMISY